MLDAGVSIVLVTDGGNGLNYYTANGTGGVTPPTVTMVDSTAAGDSFVGGFLYSLAAQNIVANGVQTLVDDASKLEKALNFACACGAYAVTQKGAFSSLPSLADIEQFFEIDPA